MTDKSVDQVISELRKLLSAETDATLARKLGVDKSTISSWRSRDSIPKRFLSILEGGNKQQFTTPPQFWGEHEDAAFELAMFRFSRATREIVAEGNYRTCVETFTKSGHFWLFLQRTKDDIVAIKNEREYDIPTAVAMLIYADLEDEATSLERDQSRLDL